MKLGAIFKTWRLAGGRIFGEFFGGLFLSAGALAQSITTIVYAAAMTPDLAASNLLTITVTDNVAFTIANPTFGGVAMSATNPVGAGLLWGLTIRNTSGGATGAITLGAAFKIGAAFAAGATATSRTFWFRWDGTNHVEVGRTAADVAN